MENEENEEKFWAEKIASLLSKEEFSDFADFIDGCDISEFCSSCAEIDQENYPEKY